MVGLLDRCLPSQVPVVRLSQWLSSTKPSTHRLTCEPSHALPSVARGILAAASNNIGGFAAPLVAGGAANAMGWRWGMYAPGMIAAVIAVLLLITIKDDPETAGYEAIDTTPAKGAPPPPPPSLPGTLPHPPTTTTTTDYLAVQTECPY